MPVYLFRRGTQFHASQGLGGSHAWASQVVPTYPRLTSPPRLGEPQAAGKTPRGRVGVQSGQEEREQKLQCPVPLLQPRGADSSGGAWGFLEELLQGRGFREQQAAHGEHKWCPARLGLQVTGQTPRPAAPTTILVFIWLIFV